jgi:hypothetical protein
MIGGIMLAKVTIGDNPPFQAKVLPPTSVSYTYGSSTEEEKKAIVEMTNNWCKMYTSASPISSSVAKATDSFDGIFSFTEVKPMSKSMVWSTTKFIGSLVKRASSYWVGEPIMLIVAKIMRSVRYMVLVSIIGSGAYTYYRPAEAATFFKSLIPSISVSFEKPDIMKG